MPRPSTRISPWIARGIASACLLIGLFATSKPVAAGPIADRINQWSLNRQSSSRSEKPFSGQSNHVEINGPSMVQKLRNRMTLKPKVDTTTHQMKTDKINHNHGMLSN